MQRVFARTRHHAVLWAPDTPSLPTSRVARASTRSLDRFVARLTSGRESLPEPVRETVMPDPAAHLFVDLAGPPSAVVAGATATPTQLTLHGELAQVAVRLRPGAVGALFGVSAHTLTDRLVPLAEVWGRSAADALVEQVLAAPEARWTTVVDEVLCSRLAGADIALDGRVSRAVSMLLEPSPVTTEELAGRLGLGRRRLEQLLRREVGLGARTLRQIGRMRAAVDALVDPTHGSLADVALTSGYADQPHLTREIKRMAGVTPGRLREFAFVQDLGPAWR